MHREGTASKPASPRPPSAAPAIGAVQVPEAEADERGSESDLRLAAPPVEAEHPSRDRHHGRNSPADDFLIADPFEVLGRAVEQSARAAGALFADVMFFNGQVDLLTTAPSTRRPSCSSSIGREASRSSRRFECRRSRRVGRARGDEPGRPRFVDAGWQLRRAGRRAAPLRGRHVLQPPALPGRDQPRLRGAA